LIMTSGDNNMTGTESIVGTVLAPIQRALYSATDAIADFFGRVFSSSDLATENLDLRAKVAELEGQLQDADETKKENERLRELLNYEAEPGVEFVTARVIGRDPNHWYSTFIINLGITDGIEIDMPVVNGEGLIGRIVEVGVTWSRVMPIVDSSSGVSGFVVRTRDNGILNGAPSAGNESAKLRMSKLVLDADLLPGDIVITSGQGGVFPKGIPIGEVTEVSQNNDGMRNQAIVTPFVDFAHLEEVMVITTFPLDVQELLQ
jgi:rod shape-determining protein MreC